MRGLLDADVRSVHHRLVMMTVRVVMMEHVILMVTMVTVTNATVSEGGRGVFVHRVDVMEVSRFVVAVVRRVRIGTSNRPWQRLTPHTERARFRSFLVFSLPLQSSKSTGTSTTDMSDAGTRCVVHVGDVWTL